VEFFTASELQQKTAAIFTSRLQSFGSGETVFANEARRDPEVKEYDIFLSHSFLDAKIIYGLKAVLEENGFSVYVYWLEDASERTRVTAETAERLRKRMQSCKFLLYATSENADNSRWMPWELGYFDGIRGKVAICPISNNSNFEGREYLGLYPHMEKDLWLWKGGKLFKKLRFWVDEK
jgi:hypothetical protein